MEETLKLADSIAEAISDSDTYKNFMKAKNEILSDSELCEKMRSFKKAHNEFSSKRAAGKDVSLYDEINVSRMYFELMNYKSSKEYLKNEQILIKLMAQVYEHLSKASVELFTDFEG